MEKEIIYDENEYNNINKIIKEYYSYLIKRWHIILFFGVIGAAIGFAYAYYDKPIYTATLSFVLEDEKGSGNGALGLASQLGLDLGVTSGNGSIFSGPNIIELMKSRSLIEKALLSELKVGGKATSFADYYIDFNGWRKKESLLNEIVFNPNMDRNRFNIKQDSVLGSIYKSLITENIGIAQRDKRVSIIYITIKSKNEIFSKNFSEVLAKVVSEFYIETKTKKSSQNMIILQNQVDSIRQELNLAMLGAASYADNNYNLNPAMNIKKVPSAKRQLDIQANSTILMELVKNLELAKVGLRRETPLIQIIDRPILPLDKQKQSKRLSLMIGFILFSFVAFTILIVKHYFNSKKNAKKYT